MGRARHDANLVPTVTGVSSTDGETPIEIWVNPSTHALLLDSSAMYGGASMDTNQVSITTSATLIVAARTTRRSVTVTNLGTTAIYIGPSGVTTTTGSLLIGTAGAAISIPTTAAVYGIVSSGTQSVSYIEVYN